MVQVLLYGYPRSEPEVKVALTVWEERISPVFDFARMLLVVEIEGREVVGRRYEPFGFDRVLRRVAMLSDLDVEVLICGAVSEPVANMIEARGIRLVPFVTGSVDQVLDAYLKNILAAPDFRMPGCGGRRRRRRRGLLPGRK